MNGEGKKIGDVSPRGRGERQRAHDGEKGDGGKGDRDTLKGR